jgi:hypothetical protein
MCSKLIQKDQWFVASSMERSALAPSTIMNWLYHVCQSMHAVPCTCVAVSQWVARGSVWLSVTADLADGRPSTWTSDRAVLTFARRVPVSLVDRSTKLLIPLWNHTNTFSEQIYNIIVVDPIIMWGHFDHRERRIIPDQQWNSAVGHELLQWGSPHRQQIDYQRLDHSHPEPQLEKMDSADWQEIIYYYTHL